MVHVKGVSGALRVSCTCEDVSSACEGVSDACEDMRV